MKKKPAKPPEPPRDWNRALTIEDAAAYLQTSTSFLQERTAAGEIKVSRPSRGVTRYRKEWLDEWLEMHSHGVTLVELNRSVR